MVSQTSDSYPCSQTCAVSGQTGKGRREPDRRPDLAHPRRGASGAAHPPHGPRPHGYATLLPSPPERSSLRAFPIGGAQSGQQGPALVTRKPGSGYGGRPRNRRLPVGVCCRGRNRPWFSRTAHLHRAGSPGGSSPLHGSLAPDSAPDGLAVRKRRVLPSAHRALHQEGRLATGVACSPLFHARQRRRGGGGNPLSASV